MTTATKARRVARTAVHRENRLIGHDRLAAARTPGYDATREGPNGIERVQIKGRAYPKGADKGQRIGKINVDAECDMVLFVLLNPATLDLREIWEAPFKAVTDRLASCTSKAHARSTLGVPEFKRIAQKIWPPKSSKRLPDA